MIKNANKSTYLAVVVLFLSFILFAPQSSFAQADCSYCVGEEDYGACWTNCLNNSGGGGTVSPLPTTPLPGGTGIGTQPGFPGVNGAGSVGGSDTGSSGGSGGGSAPKSPEGVISKLCGVLRPAFWTLMFLSLAFVLYASFLYITSSGDPEKVKTANKTILFAAIAIAVALLAKELPWIVSNLVNINLPSDAGVSAVDSSC